MRILKRMNMVLCMMAILFVGMAVFTPEEAQAATKNKTYTVYLNSNKTAKVTGHYEEKIANELFKLINNYRKSNKLNTLSKKKALTTAANTRAVECSYKFSHTRPNGKKFSTVSSLAKGENILEDNSLAASKRATAKSYLTDFKNSKTHNANMLYKKWKTMAVSVFVKPCTHPLGIKYDAYYVAVEFGK